MRSRAKSLKRKSKVRRTGDPIAWKYCLLTLVCGLLLVAGFFYAARQHFASVNTSMDNAKLRRNIEELKSQERRLKLAREVASTPGEIKKAAEKLGLQSMTARNLEVVKHKSEKKKVAPSNDKKSDSKKVKATKELTSKEKFDNDKKKAENQEVATESNNNNEKESSKDSDRNDA